jgi:flagellar M-ring protein FliF
MPPAVAEPLASLGQRWMALPRALRVLLVTGVVVSVLAVGAVYALNAYLDDYQVLYSNLSPEDAGAVVEALRAGKVPYRAGESGQVLVPASRVHEWRMRLASQGMPSGGVVGFEIFDKNQFGLTDFSQRLNFQRALQGELARTIGQLREVQQARVHLAIPTPRVFSSQDKPPSASVVLRLRAGSALRPDQVRGIVHLVTAAVEGLAPERVTVVDTSGRVLASGQEQRAGGLSGNQVEARSSVEQDVERRIQGLLDPIVGAGRSAVRVSAVVNFDQIERTEERFEPNPLIRSQTKSKEQTQGSSSQPTSVTTVERSPGDRGSERTSTERNAVAPGQERSASERTQVLSSTSTNQTQRESEQTSYEIARTVEKTVVAPGDVKRLSVGVLLDVPLVKGTRAPRPDEEIERIKKLVASAAGIRPERKDELEVLQVPFDPGIAGPGDAGAGAPTAAAPPRVPQWVWIAGGVGGALVMGGLFFTIWRASRRRAALRSAVMAAVESGGGAGEALARAMGGPAGADDVDITPLNLNRKLSGQELLRERIRVAAKDHPEEMAEIIRAWMVKRRPGAA